MDGHGKSRALPTTSIRLSAARMRAKWRCSIISPTRKGVGCCTCCASQLGDDLYRRCIKTYLERHQLGNVVTEDLRRVIEELSGRNFDQFFDQWLYHGYHPELELKYSWDEGAKMAKLSVRQTQKVSEQVLLFNFPVTVRFEGAFGRVERKLEVKQKEEDFYFAVASAPKIRAV